MAKSDYSSSEHSSIEDEHLQSGMKEIAERVGVSKTTVHRALTGRGRISAATRDKILAVAAEVDYTPNILARSLRQQKTGTIGLIANGMASSFHANLLNAIEEAASGQGFSLLLCVTGDQPDLEEHYLNLLREQRVDGLLIAPSNSTSNVEHFERLKRAEVPFVFVDRTVPAVSADAVMTDHRLAGQLVAEHLIAGGRKRIGIVAPVHEKYLATSVQERISGVEDVTKQYGAKTVKIGLKSRWEPLEDYAAQSFGAFLDAGSSTDALFGINDHYAVGAMRLCHDRGIRVPDDVAICGYDDLEISSFLTPRLTSIRQPTRQIAWEAVKMLLNRIGGTRPEAAVTLRLRPALMERESTPRVEPSGALTPQVEP